MPLVVGEEVLLVDQDAQVDLVAVDPELVEVLELETNGHLMLLVSLVLLLVKEIMVDAITAAQDLTAAAAAALVVLVPTLVLVQEMVEPLFPIVLLVLL
jgi:hypothetical protein